MGAWGHGGMALGAGPAQLRPTGVGMGEPGRRGHGGLYPVSQICLQVIKAIRTRVPQISANLSDLKRSADEGGLRLGGVQVAHMSDVSEHTAVAPGAMPRRVRPASGPTVVNMGREGHEWREFDAATSMPSPADAKSELLNLHAVQGWMHYHAVERRVMGAASRRYNQRKLKETFQFWRTADIVVAALIYKRVIVQGKFREMFRWWREIRTLLKAGRHSMARATRTVKNVGLLVSLEAWRTYTSQSLYTTHLFRGAGNRLFKRSMVQGFEHWRQGIDDDRTAVLALSKAVMRLFKQRYIKGLAVLRKAARQKRDQRQRFKRAVMRLMYRATWGAFSVWRDAVVVEHKQRLLLRRVTMRMMCQGMALALYTWQDAAAAARANLKLINRILRRVLNRKLYGAWECWYHNVRGNQQSSTKLQAAARFAFKLRWRKAVELWGEWLGGLRAQQKQKNLMKRVAMSIMLRDIRKLWNEWRDTCASNREQLEEMKKVPKLGSVPVSTVAPCADRWPPLPWGPQPSPVPHHPSISPVSCQVMRYLFNMSLARGWLAWNEMTHETLHAKTSLLKAVRALSQRATSQAWNMWRGAFRDAQGGDNAERRAQRLLMKIFSSKYTKAFNAWQGAPHGTP